mgnify:CR=1 FL=1
MSEYALSVILNTVTSDTKATIAWADFRSGLIALLDQKGYQKRSKSVITPSSISDTLHTDNNVLNMEYCNEGVYTITLTYTDAQLETLLGSHCKKYGVIQDVR